MASAVANKDLPKIDQAWVEKHIGLVCDGCGGNVWLVTNTWKRPEGLIRRRVCRQCKYVVYTTEKPIS